MKISVLCEKVEQLYLEPRPGHGYEIDIIVNPTNEQAQRLADPTIRGYICDRTGEVIIWAGGDATHMSVLKAMGRYNDNQWEQFIACTDGPTLDSETDWGEGHTVTDSGWCVQVHVEPGDLNNKKNFVAAFGRLNELVESRQNDAGKPSAKSKSKSLALLVKPFEEESKSLERLFNVKDRAIQQAIWQFTKQADRFGWGKVLGHMPKVSALLRSLQQKSVALDDRYHVYAALGDYNPDRDIKNGVFKMDNFIETTLNIDAAVKISNKRKGRVNMRDDHIMHFALPKGYTGGFYIAEYSDKPEELEMILFPKQKFKQVLKKTLDLGGGDKRYIWSMVPLEFTDGKPRTDIALNESGKNSWAKGEVAFYEYHCHMSHDSEDAQLWYRSHSKCKILGVSEEGVGKTLITRINNGEPRVYKVKFEDGFEGDVFEDELLISDRFYNPTYDPPPESERKILNNGLITEFKNVGAAMLPTHPSNCWILPDGKTLPVQSYNHSRVAFEHFAVEQGEKHYDSDFAMRAASRNGWIRVFVSPQHDSVNVEFDMKHATPRGLSVLVRLLKDDFSTYTIEYGQFKSAGFKSSRDALKFMGDLIVKAKQGKITESLSSLYSKFEGFGGLCGQAAIAINRAIFSNRGKLIGAFNEAFFEHGYYFGHVAVEMEGIYWDSDARAKNADDIESWGMLDPEDLDYRELADDIGVEWNDDTASKVVWVEMNESEAIEIFGSDQITKMFSKLSNPR